MVGARRSQSQIFPLVLILLGAAATAGLLVDGGVDWTPVPLIAVVFGVWMALQPGPQHVELTAPLGGLSAAHLAMLADGAELEMRTHDLDEELYRAALTYRGRRPAAVLDREHGTLHLELPHPWWRSVVPQPYAERAVVMLSSRLPWSLDLHGDALGGRIDLSRAALRELALTCGGGELQVDLPAPQGAVPIHLSSSRVRATLTLPEGVPIQLASETGTWHVEVPEHRGSQAPPLGRHVVSSGDREGVPDRYLVVLEGGGRVRVERR